MSDLIPNDLPPGSPLAALLMQSAPQEAAPPPPPMTFSPLPPQAPPAQAPTSRPLQGAQPPRSAGPSGPQLAQQRLDQDRQMMLEEMQGIGSTMDQRYGNYQQGASALKDLLSNTAQMLQNTPVGPSPAERMGRLAQAMGAPTRTGSFGERMGNVAGASADLLAQQRQQDLEKKMLVAKYGIDAGTMGLQASQMGLQQLNSRLNNTQTRLGSIDIANARQNSPTALVIRDANGQLATNPEAIAAQGQLAGFKAASIQKAKADISAGQFSPEALDLLAEQTYRTGKLNVPYGLVRNDPTIVSKIWNMAAAKAAAENNQPAVTLANQNVYKSAQSAMTKVLGQQSMVGSYEKTAEKNMDLAIQLGRQTDRSGSPLINRGIMAWRQGVTGDKDTAAFVNAIRTAQTEYAKVLSGATGAAGITDQADREAKELFSKITNQETLEYVIETAAKPEMHNRMTSFADQQNDLKGLMGLHAPSTPGDSASQPQQGAAPRPRTATGPNGEKVQFVNGQWVPM